MPNPEAGPKIVGLPDRLLHHPTTINIKGESFRLKEKRKAGLLNKTESNDEEVPADAA